MSRDTNLRVDEVTHDELAGTLHGLLIRFGDRLQDDDNALIGEFIDASVCPTQ